MRTYREVMCPICRKKYMTVVYKEDGYDYCVKSQDKTMHGWQDRCPKCGTSLFVVDGALDGIVFDEIPKSAVEQIGGWTLR